jgi:hypothetical protein
MLGCVSFRSLERPRFALQSTAAAFELRSCGGDASLSRD